jgi:hypothetical protein
MVNSESEIFKKSKKISELININKKIKFDPPYTDYDSFNMSIIGNKSCFRNSNFRPKSNAAGKNSFLSMAEIDDNVLSNLKKINYRGFNVPLWDRYNGMEDPKLIEWKEELWCLFVRPNHHINKIWMILLNLETGKSYHLFDPAGRNFTKNWMPLVKDDRLFFVTDVDPFMVYEFLDEKLHIIHSSSKKYPFLIHGSSNIIEFDNKFLGIIHGRFEYEPKNWFYWHSFMSWDRDWLEMKMGQVFYFENKQVEFCLSWEIIENKIRIPYSVEDANMSMLEFDIDQLGVLL